MTNRRSSFMKYYFYKFEFLDGKEFIATCLLADNLEVILSLIYDKNIDTKFKLFPSI